jgi:quercetin dioxygenase-like cupin family protein
VSSDAAPAVRRIVTGHNPAGEAIIAADEQLAATGLIEDAGRVDARFFQLWATHEVPVDLSDEAMARQQQGSASTVVGSGTGTVLRIGVLAPGSRSPLHRTQSLDYAICLEGECDLELDGGEVVTVGPGDVIVQRGTNHVWHNRSAAPCRFAWILIDGRPVTVDGQRLEVSWRPAP